MSISTKSMACRGWNGLSRVPPHVACKGAVAYCACLFELRGNNPKWGILSHRKAGSLGAQPSRYTEAPSTVGGFVQSVVDPPPTSVAIP